MKCPYCGENMFEGYFIISGGVWWNESREYLESYIGSHQSSKQPDCCPQQHPMHCIIGSRGYHGGNEEWPKVGFLCKNSTCLCIVMRPTPR